MSKAVRLVLLIILAGVFVFSSYKVISGLVEYKKGDNAYESIAENFISRGTRKTRASTETPIETEFLPEGSTEEPLPDYSAHEQEGALSLLSVPFDYLLMPEYELDFDGLKAMNEEICAWVCIEDTHINYPMVQGKNNSDYLRRGADGQPLNAGSIFVDYRHKTPFNCDNTIVYGHNQRNGAMFHDLYKYKDRAFALSHPYIEVYLPDGSVSLYRVFSSYVTDSRGRTYLRKFSSYFTFAEYVEYCKNLSLFDYGVPVSDKNQVLTLSTCTNEQDSDRVVVQGKLIYRSEPLEAAK